MTRPPRIHAPLSYSFNQVLEGIANENRPLVRSQPAKPFLKWVGGKRSILEELQSRLPKQYGNYYEPFVGGGALFFALQPKHAFLSDVNFHLVLAYRVIRDNVDELIGLLAEHKRKHSKPYFLKARLALAIESDKTKIASLLIYLNKTCYNGLYRVNQSGEFNVPMGDYTDPPILDEETLRADHTALQGVEIIQQDFSKITPCKGAFYYLDPPYHETYDGYNGNGFGDERHRDLAKFCEKIHAVGSTFMLSNSDTDLVRSLYKQYHVEQVSASRSISCKSHQRGKANELIIRNY